MELWITLAIFYVIGFPIVYATWEHFNAEFLEIDFMLYLLAYAFWPISFPLWTVYRLTNWFWEHTNG